MRSIRALAIVFVALSLAGEAEAFWGSKPPKHGEAWWRTDGTGRYPKATPPLTWSPTQNVVWKRPLSNWSNATPVLHKGRIFTCEEPSTLVCLDLKTGEELWRADVNYDAVQGEDVARYRQQREELTNRQRDLQKKRNELKSASRGQQPDAAAQTEIANARADLQSVLSRIQEVDQRLRVSGIPATHGSNGYTSQTPVAAGDRLWVLFGTGVAAAFDLSGKRLWASVAGRPTNGWGHSASPVLVDGKLILHIDRTVHALDPESGAELWSAPSASWWGTPFPVEVGGEWAVVTTGGDLIRCRDGKVVSSQIGGIPWTSPYAEKGVVYVVDENGAAAWKLPPKLEDSVQLERLWQTSVPRDRYYATLLLHEGLIYSMTQTSHMTVLDAATGAIVYQRGLNLGATAYPSFCLAGGKVFASSESGKTVVFEPGREFREVAVNTLESFRSTPVFSGPRVYIRGLTHLWCLGPGE
jgi:outer membrane protein assembly factor BamB